VGADNSRNLTPTQVGTGYTRVAVGPTHLCALDLGSILFCWGGNDSGELGILPTGSTSTPSRVTGQRAGGP
jgi:alpha-tubulin suppressor-like RCC1 family protein